nr:DUF928 domain-containing protein [Iningainema tapete]
MSRYLFSALSVIVVANSLCCSAYAVTFTPPTNNGAPSVATGGASRGSFFTPKKGNGVPSQATGGASRSNLFTPVKGNGAPQQASGGASRVGTYHLNPSIVTTAPATLIALLPQSFSGTTVSARPTVMVYIPASNAQEAVFSIKDDGKTLYKMTIPVAGKTGAMSTTGFAYAIKLPADAPALAVGKNYQWFLALKVNGQLSPSTPYVDGWIQRIQPNAELVTAMQQQDALQRATAFGKHGVWYDCVATLAALYAEKPNNATITQQWEELLTSVSLEEIATAPIVISAN